MNRIRRVAAALAGLAVTWLGLAAGAPAAFAVQASPPGAAGPKITPAGFAIQAPGGGGGSAGSGIVSVTRTVVVGGMPGWQIALIAVAAALVAASLAVLADRARSPHRISTPTVA